MIFNLVSIFLGIFLVSYILTNLFPIIKRNLLIPLTSIFIIFYFVYGSRLKHPAIENADLTALVYQIEKALGFNIAQLVYWFILFLFWLLAAGVATLLLDLFLRDRAEDIYIRFENHLSLYGLRNILTIACFLIPLAVIAGMYYEFMDTGFMFVAMLCFVSAELEILFSSAKRQTVKVGEKNLFFLITITTTNVLILLLSMALLLDKRS